MQAWCSETAVAYGNICKHAGGHSSRAGLGVNMFQGEGSGQTPGLLQGTAKKAEDQECAVPWKPGKDECGEQGVSQGQVLLRGQEGCCVPRLVDTRMRQKSSQGSGESRARSEWIELPAET